jgi:hypothetical protein
MLMIKRLCAYMMITAAIINPSMVMADTMGKSSKQKISMIARNVFYAVGATIATAYALRGFNDVRSNVIVAIHSKRLPETPIDFAFSCAQLIVSGLVAKYLWSK